MDYETYQILRRSPRTDLAPYIDTPTGEAACLLLMHLHGPVGELQHEHETAMSFFHCKDLTLREHSAAHLLAVINNHRAMTWQREPAPPGGKEPAPALTPEQSASAWEATRRAAEDYAAHIPEREAAALLKAVQAPETATPAPVAACEIDFSLIATRSQLIDAFGGITKMDITWFENLKDAPKLLAARKVAGQGGRNGAEPLFCPFAVMQWLVDPKRRKEKGKPMNDTTAWRLLKGHFPKVYNLYSVGDPNND